MYSNSPSCKLAEIRQLGRRAVIGFQRLSLDQRRAVVERLDTVTADKLRAAVNEVVSGQPQLNIAVDQHHDDRFAQGRSAGKEELSGQIRQI